MELIPYNWNVVLLGFWNKAILTPNFISNKIFRNEIGTPINVEVPIDLMGPIRTKYDKFIVFVDSTQVIVEITDCLPATLIKAFEYSKNVLDELPVTPLIAAGFNLRYKITNFDPHELNSLIGTNIDNKIALQQYNILVIMLR